VIERLFHLLLAIPPPLVVPAVFLISAAETAAFMGIVLPGEAAVILGGVIASQGRVPLWAVVAAGVLGPLAGDSIGYFVGRRYDATKLKGRAARRWEKTRKSLDEKGGSAVFFGRFAAFLRSIIPAAAGAAKMPYRKFLLFDVPACVFWGVGSALLGYYAGTNWQTILHFAGAIAIAVFAVLVFFLIRRLRRKRRA
jgi:membrane-associated protein